MANENGFSAHKRFSSIELVGTVIFLLQGRISVTKFSARIEISLGSRTCSYENKAQTLRFTQFNGTCSENHDWKTVRTSVITYREWNASTCNCVNRQKKKTSTESMYTCFKKKLQCITFWCKSKNYNSLFFPFKKTHTTKSQSFSLTFKNNSKLPRRS